MARPQEFNTSEALHQAMDLFWRKGYEATSMADLLKATGLSKSSLYAAFGGKYELFVAAFDAYRAEREREAKLILSQGTAREAIENLFEKIIRDALAGVSSRGCMSINQAVEMAPHDLGIRARVQADFALIEDMLTRTIERGQSEGSIKSTDKARNLARLLVLALPGLQVMARAGSDIGQLEQNLNLLLSGLD